MQDGWTALGKASFYGHHKVVELLLGAGASPDLQDVVRKNRSVSCETGRYTENTVIILIER